MSSKKKFVKDAEPATPDTAVSSEASIVDALVEQRKAVEAIVDGYGCGQSIPELLKAVLTELVMIRTGGGHV